MFASEMAMNQTCYALKSSSEHDLWLNSTFANLVDHLVNAAHGSVFDTITTRTLESASVLDPGTDLRSAYENLAGPMFERLRAALCERRTLAALRDALLPKLISGDLRLDDPEGVSATAG
jgi:type I restriction enzyme S subunit